MLRRVGSMILAVMMLISMLCTVTVVSADPAGLPAVVLSADAATVKHGQTVTVTVSMENAVDMAGIQIALPYNKALYTFAGYAEKLSGFTVVNADDAFIHIGWAGDANVKPTALVDLQFTVTDTIVAGQNYQTVQEKATVQSLYRIEGAQQPAYDTTEYVAESNSLSFTVDCTEFYAFKTAATSGTATTAKHVVACTKCGAEKTEACQFGQPQEFVKDTCDVIGKERITCEICEYFIETDVDEITDHDWATAWTQDPDAEQHYKVCNNGCGAKSEITACGGWTWNNVATKDGSKHVCADCGREIACKWQENPRTEPATCTEDAYTVWKCTITGCTGNHKVVHTDTAIGHAYDNTCDKTCNNGCGFVRPIQHKYDNDCDANCNVCGTPRTVTHKYTNSCDATCNVCGTPRQAGHTFGAYVYNNDATTTKDGTKTRTCSACGEKETVTAAGTKLNNPFVDVKDSEFYTTPVIWAVENGITNGTSATTFGPNDPCTRGQIVTFLWRAAGSPEPTSSRNPFKDVKSSDYYYKAVLWAVEKGITNGVSATEFAPNATCTRGQVVTFLWRAKGKPSVSGTNPFTDVKAGEYYTEAVVWAVKNGITTGMSATTFAPNNNCTRGQIVTFLYRAYK